ncbi:MAG: bifunctional 3-demethylubiquinol 3-O-methyltransferase/2-polyprenyl-6-hydroxyphenol methylase [Gammaproteobacteria bacterium]|nr:MAG: bifunctional 3-demethylubiquinol 3-O-methyltransferase/2-polyprenyl-6-hydroxyphenol methylase [Gammaproteobacteria bacterium]RLA21993.1 MAG: bifunctional 3-demethylubiquinol 3-O-methyltransferase/2-polyprenyl-6-hydroxyphenol methylase [Gammaproteobacteria bacterium]
MSTNVNPAEIDKFSALASRWWDPKAEFKTLHDLNPLRVQYMLDNTEIMGKKVLDVGCGGGILSEALAKQGAQVTGIDMGQKLIDIAELHSLESGVDVTYKKVSVEEFAEQNPASFDCVTCMEMLEHVPDPASIIDACAKLVKPGGMIFFSTLNRNPKSYLSAIIGAEYLMKILPKGTHDYASFIKPSELSGWARDSGLELKKMTGIIYNPFTTNFSLGDNIDINYIALFQN